MVCSCSVSNDLPKFGFGSVFHSDFIIDDISVFN